MLFNSIEFFIFLPIVFILYWFVTNKNLKAQNFLVAAASFFFYGWWDWRFLSLLAFSSLLDFGIGLLLEKTEDNAKRKWLLFTSMSVNLGLLGFFKYFNFFVQSFTDAFTFFGGHLEPTTLHIVLPVGISFYTFQTMSYTIDVYKKELKPTKDIVAFLAFVSFFPQLVAGPIERATNLLPQFYTPRKFDYALATDGCRQMLWGFFKKIVIADNCAVYANQIFNGYEDYSGSTLLMGAFFFTFQIYGDFSGYSDIAIGLSRLFGFDLMRNFAFPYFSRDIAEFWRRWHISLSTWFRDYVYIPLGGSKGGLGMKIRNTFIIFLLSGFWHGANWTFVFWGGLNAIYFLPSLIMGNNRNNLDIVAKGRWLPSMKEFLNIGVTFFLTVIAWIFFRSESLAQAFTIVGRIFSSSLFSVPTVIASVTLFYISVLLAVEWIQREHQHALYFGNTKIPLWGRLIIYYVLFFAIMSLGAGGGQNFIYFQF